MPFVQTLRCSCEKKRAGREMAILLCEVPVNKDIERERGGEKGT